MPDTDDWVEGMSEEAKQAELTRILAAAQQELRE